MLYVLNSAFKTWNNVMHHTFNEHYVAIKAIDEEEPSPYRELDNAITVTKEVIQPIANSQNLNETVFIYVSTVPQESFKIGKSKNLLFQLPNIMAQRINNEIGMKNVYTLYGSCGGTLQALELAEALLESKKYTFVVITAVEIYKESIVNLFDTLNILHEDCTSIPFHHDNNGITIGEGAVSVLVSNYRYCKPHLKIHNITHHYSSDFTQIGKEGIYSIMNTLTKYLPNTNLDVIIPHGSGTNANDTEEAIILQEYLSKFSSMTYPKIIPLKGYLGHTMSCSGLLEPLFYRSKIMNHEMRYLTGTYNNLKEKVYPLIANRLIHQDEVWKPQKEYSSIFIKLAYGMGGIGYGILGEVYV